MTSPRLARLVAAEATADIHCSVPLSAETLAPAEALTQLDDLFARLGQRVGEHPGDQRRLLSLKLATLKAATHPLMETIAKTRVTVTMQEIADRVDEIRRRLPGNLRRFPPRPSLPRDFWMPVTIRLNPQDIVGIVAAASERIDDLVDDVEAGQTAEPSEPEPLPWNRDRPLLTEFRTLIGLGINNQGDDLVRAVDHLREKLRTRHQVLFLEAAPDTAEHFDLNPTPGPAYVTTRPALLVDGVLFERGEGLRPTAPMTASPHPDAPPQEDK
jgi:hypothetical protein